MIPNFAYFNTKIDVSYVTGIETSENFQCNICGKKLSRRQRLKKHLEGHQGIRELFQCPYCGQEFTWRESYNKHMKLKH